MQCCCGKFEPDSENQTEKDVSNNPLQPGNPYSDVKDGGWVDKENLDDEGQGRTPSGKAGFSFTASEDSRDPVSTEYFVLEGDEHRDTRGKAEATTHGLENSPEKQSTEYFLLERGGAREVTDTSLGDHTQTE